MKAFIAAFLAFLATFVPGSFRVTNGFSGYAPGNVKKQPVVSIAPSSSVAATPSKTPTTLSGTSIPNSVPTIGVPAAYTPTNVLKLVDGVHQYAVTMRSEEVIMLTSFIPMKGSTVESVDLPASGAPSGVYFTQDASITDRKLYIHTDTSAVPGTYKWRQSFTAKFSSGTAPGSLSMGIVLTILPPR